MSTSPARRGRANPNGCEPLDVAALPVLDVAALPEAEPGALDGLWTKEGRLALALVLVLSGALAALFLWANAALLVEAAALLRQLLR
jgi:hypothetical protein